MKVRFEKLDIYHPHSNIWKRKWVIFLWVSALAETQEILGLGNLNRRLQLWHPCFQHSAFIDFFFNVAVKSFQIDSQISIFLRHKCWPKGSNKVLEVGGFRIGYLKAPELWPTNRNVLIPVVWRHKQTFHLYVLLTQNKLSILWRYPCKYINFSVSTDESLLVS